jgi:hypothetical protein
MNGLHACKPGNEPQVGQVKTFVVEQRTGKSGKAYTKIKSASADMGGQPYRITAAKPTGHTDSYGNVSFNLDIEPANGSAPATSAPPSPYQQSAPKDPRSNGGGKEGYWERKEAADIAKQPRIERQHAQEMALRYFDLDTVPDNQLPPKLEKLREMIDWFQKDVGHVPAATESPRTHVTRDMEDADPHRSDGTPRDAYGDGPPDDEIPF